ncbi:Na+/H+ antiporter, partial [Rhodococcus hoagii]|nr:Na+/H+ antiporter [Prescottella equi]
MQLPDIVKAVVSHETTLWPTLAWRCLDVVAIFAALIVLRFIWYRASGAWWGVLRRWRGKPALVMLPTARSCWLLTLG